MHRRTLWTTAAGLLLAAAVLTVPTPAVAAVALPNSMASTGDSITRAFDIDWSHLLSDSPQYSWSTGTSTGINSHYRRILAANPGISGHAYNDAVTGAKMVDLHGQVMTAASQNVDYLTILMGANDLCTSSVSTMTATATLQSQFQQSLADFTAADPHAVIFVSSIPNIYQLWQVLHTNFSAQLTWASFGICQSMLSTSNTETQRQQVVAREQADNQALATVCAAFVQCRWDNLATYQYAFRSTDVSTVDYFHPSLAGQNALASVSWGASYWA